MDKRTRKVLCSIPGYDPFAGADAYVFDKALAYRALRFIQEFCTFTAGEKAGTPFILEPWQQAIVLNLFGWYRKSDGLRRYRETFIFVPRKNGKTELAAAILLCVMFLDNESGMELYSAGADREQATLVFKAVKMMLLQHEPFRQYCRIFNRAITRVRRGIECASYKAITSGADTKHGYKAHFVCVDELHVHKNSELLDVLVTSTGSRREPLVLIITTADHDRQGSPCNQRRDYAVNVRDGVIRDLSFLPVIYEASIEDDWTSEETWRKANPNYGVSLRPEYMVTECEKAKTNPAYENVFKRLHLNIRTETEARMFDMAAWDKCAAGHPPLEFYAGKECYAALDIGSTSDLTALCLCFKRGDEDDTWDYYWWHWTTRHNIVSRSRKHGIDYIALERRGEIVLTEGNETDYALVRSDINALADKFGISVLAVDRLYQGAQLAQQLQSDGFNVKIFGQTHWWLAAPTVEFIRRINNGKMAHSGSDIMRWQIRNTQAKMDSEGNIKPDKEKSKNKIDGVVTAVMCTALASAYTQSKESIYETKELIVL